MHTPATKSSYKIFDLMQYFNDYTPSLIFSSSTKNPKSLQKCERLLFK